MSKRTLLASGIVAAILVLPSSLASAAVPGASLAPIKAMAYQPAPSNYTASGGPGGIYYDTDFFNADFQQLWGTANGGRGDLKTMDGLGVNFLHLYDWNPGRNHLPALNSARKRGIGVGVPISNYFVGGSDPNAAADIKSIVAQIYVNSAGNPSTTPHPAVEMITIANEPDQAGWPNWPALVTTAAENVVAAENAVGATQLLPVAVPFTFGIDTTDANANNPQGLAAVGQFNAIMASFSASPSLGPSFVSSRYVAATNPEVRGQAIRAWLPKFASALPSTPLWFSEMGIDRQDSCDGYPASCTPTQNQQATFNLGALNAGQPSSLAPNLLGGTQFEFMNEPWKSPASQQTWGVYNFGSSPSSTTGKTTSGQSFPIDKLFPKPSLNSLQQAFGA
jgi:hypothetical protein